ENVTSYDFSNNQRNRASEYFYNGKKKECVRKVSESDDLAVFRRGMGREDVCIEFFMMENKEDFEKKKLKIKMNEVIKISEKSLKEK
ncbi:hypothetical protein H311_05035, partial [Anncaliia algerae PRA109]